MLVRTADPTCGCDDREMEDLGRVSGRDIMVVRTADPTWAGRDHGGV